MANPSQRPRAAHVPESKDPNDPWIARTIRQRAALPPQNAQTAHFGRRTITTKMTSAADPGPLWFPVLAAPEHPDLPRQPTPM